MALTVSNITGQGLSEGVVCMKGVNDGSAAAASIFLGFTPRRADVFNITDGIANHYFPDNTAGKTYNIDAAGVVTVAAANGFTALDGTEASPATKATGSPASSGPGITLGTGILLASKTYQMYFYK